MVVRPWETQPFAIVDGGLSTALELLGHRISGLLWTAQLLLDRPEEIVRAHRSFVDAGAEVVITSSYQASEGGFVRAGASAAQARRVLASTTDLARRSGAAVVACSVGPFGATLGDGSEYHGRYEASWAEVRAFHAARLDVLTDTAPDVFAIETIPSRAEAEIALEELEARTATPAWVSYSCRDDSHTCAGDAFAEAVRAAEACALTFAVGLNCTDPDHVAPLLRVASSATDLPLVAYPNHGGDWDAAAECWIGEADGTIAARAASWVEAGARLIGGCCGIGPDGVRALVGARAALASRA